MNRARKFTHSTALRQLIWSLHAMLVCCVLLGGSSILLRAPFLLVSQLQHQTPNRHVHEVREQTGSIPQSTVSSVVERAAEPVLEHKFQGGTRKTSKSKACLRVGVLRVCNTAGEPPTTTLHPSSQAFAGSIPLHCSSVRYVR